MQRYISRELTHFAGRAKSSLDERYSILKIILGSRRLLASPGDGSSNPGGRWTKRGNKPASSNERYSTGIVCFCDIPVEDFAVHISKYGPFGIAWEKSYLVERGACPVFYIARNSVVAVEGHPSRAEYFDRMIQSWEKFIDAKSLNPIHAYLSSLNVPGPGEAPVSLTPEETTKAVSALSEMQTFFGLSQFIEPHIFCFLKFFDAKLVDDHPDNFYMEREWRLIGNLDFELDSVRRVILPQAFASRFRADFPDYSGSVHVLPSE